MKIKKEKYETKKSEVGDKKIQIMGLRSENYEIKKLKNDKITISRE